MTTIRDVAKRAGVAPITVSRVLNNSGYASPETRARVERAAAELNFVPNMLASSLRSNQTQTLALVLSDITNPFWTEVARSVEDEAHRHGYMVIFCNSDEDEGKQEQYLNLLLRRRVDGVLLVPASSSGAAVAALRAHRVQVVVLDRRLPGVEADLVRGDSVGGAHELTAHLLGLGHRRIAVLAGPADVSVVGERVAGYRQALAGAGVAGDDELILYGRFTVESGHEMAQTLLARPQPPTALFAANNFLAIGALRALYAAGLRVPDDVSVAAFDELPYTELRAPFLTVEAQPTRELGSIAVRRLLDRIAEAAQGLPPAPCAEIVLPTRLKVRASTGPPASGRS